MEIGVLGKTLGTVQQHVGVVISYRRGCVTILPHSVKELRVTRMLSSRCPVTSKPAPVSTMARTMMSGML